MSVKYEAVQQHCNDHTIMIFRPIHCYECSTFTLLCIRINNNNSTKQKQILPWLPSYTEMEVKYSLSPVSTCSWVSHTTVTSRWRWCPVTEWGLYVFLCSFSKAKQNSAFNVCQWHWTVDRFLFGRLKSNNNSSWLKSYRSYKSTASEIFQTRYSDVIYCIIFICTVWLWFGPSEHTETHTPRPAASFGTRRQLYGNLLNIWPLNISKLAVSYVTPVCVPLGVNRMQKSDSQNIFNHRHGGV